MSSLRPNDPVGLRGRFAKGRRWVVKIGSALSSEQGVGLDVSAINTWAEQIVELQAAGRQIVTVASGSVAEGAVRLGWEVRPHSLNHLQAAAAVGQMGLVRVWDQAFEKFGHRSAQVLLTHEDLADRQRYLNARSTLLTLLDLGVFPIVNENDTVATEEISLGDNDTLAGFVSNLIDADLMIVLTDQEGLMTADPRHAADAELIGHALVDDPILDTVAGDGGAWGRGGMRTKLHAAKLAARSATSTIIASGRNANVLRDIAAGKSVGSLLYSNREKIAARKQWLAGSLRVRGTLVVDNGARHAICEQGKSLLPVGVTEVIGDFSRGELISLKDREENEVGRGLANYSSGECRRVAGIASAQIENELGYTREPELVHRDNLVIVAEE